jgi:hypothetical protein
MDRPADGSSGDQDRVARAFSARVRSAVHNADHSLGLGLAQDTLERLAAFLPGFVLQDFDVAWKPCPHSSTCDPGDEGPHQHWERRDDELDALAEGMLGLTSAQAREQAEQHGVSLKVENQVGVGYVRNYVAGRISVQAYDGIVTRAQRG